MKIDPEQWARLSALLDAALDVDVNEREAWLQRLPNDASELKEPLRTLLMQRAHIETGDFLKMPDFASVLRSEAVRSQASPIDLRVGGEVGAYRLLRELGRGGMGSVWLAERIDGKLKRQVALKFPYAGPNQRQLAERLSRERDILASLEHSNIARLYDADVTSVGQPFLVLEYVDGTSINEYCDQNRLKIRERVQLFLQVLSAVQYAHTHLVVHRDLKPSNILVRSDRVAQLLDFGIAKLISEGEQESALTQFGGRALTPDYASPEQINGEPITTACDIYSLGVVLYELLTGHRPYRLKRDSRASLEDAIAHADVMPLSRAAADAETAAMRSSTVSQLQRQLRGDLETIVLKALRKEPKDRYASADAFMRDLQHSLDQHPIDAQPHSRLYLFKKLVARNRAAVGSAMAVLLLLIAGIATTTWQAARARESEQRALAAAETSDAVKQFMTSIFQTNTLGQEDPAKARQKNALQLLEEGANRVAAEFANNPPLHREMLAVILRLLGESRSAQYPTHALRYIELLKDVPGGELKQAEIYNELSIMAQGTDADACEAHAKSGLAILAKAADASVGSAHRKQRAMLLGSFAVARQLHGDAAGAVVALQEAEQLLATEFSHTAEYGVVLSELGWADMRRDRVAQAVDYFERAMRAYLSDPTAYQRTIAQGRGDLSAGYSMRKQYALAERELRLAAEEFNKGYGPADPETALAKARLAKAIAMQNRYDEALGLLREVMPTLAAQSVNYNPNYLLASLEYFADTLVQAGRVREAEPEVQRALDFAMAQSTRAQINPLFIASEYTSMRGRTAEALTNAQRAVDLTIEIYGENNARVARANNRLGRVLIASGKIVEADALFAKSMEADAANAAVFNSSWTVASVQRARVSSARGQAEQAVSAITAAMNKYRAQPLDQRDLNDEIELELELGRALMAAKRPAEAQPQLARALELLQTQYALSPRLAEAQAALADCKFRLGDLERSRELLTQAEAIHSANPQLGSHYRQPILDLSQRLASAEKRRTGR